MTFAVRCNNEDPFEFPLVYLNASINIFTDPEFISLIAPGNSLEITHHPNGDASIGYNNNGIIVYNSGDDKEPFYAFDRTCPHDLPASVAINSNGSSATCPECGSQFVFPSEGQPSIGSASKYYLKKYKTYYNPNTGDLVITH
ncbi:MAG: hypothetical protein JXA77_16355 [Bacteroidales bacterium]|nr:hypothetical protein [Bacteroidales bacterium]MBN2818875.1 hypothetical protein [Bacteroidales bacterium]